MNIFVQQLAVLQ